MIRKKIAKRLATIGLVGLLSGCVKSTSLPLINPCAESLPSTNEYSPLELESSLSFTAENGDECTRSVFMYVTPKGVISQVVGRQFCKNEKDKVKESYERWEDLDNDGTVDRRCLEWSDGYYELDQKTEEEINLGFEGAFEGSTRTMDCSNISSRTMSNIIYMNKGWSTKSNNEFYLSDKNVRPTPHN